MADLHRNAIAVRDAAAARGVAIEPVEFPAGTRTADDAAAAIGVAVGQIVKSLVFAVGPGEGDPVIALVSGSNQLDERLLAAAAGHAGTKAKRVDADRVRAVTGFPVGGVPPFGHANASPVFLDEDLLQYDVVWAACGTPHINFAIAPQALAEATGAIITSLAKR